MRAVDHWRLAHEIAAEVLKQIQDGGLGDGDAATIGVLLAQGQLSATLALAGATALQAYSSGDEPELDEWQAVAGGAG